VPVCGKAEVFSSDLLEFWHKQASFTGIFVSIKCLTEDNVDLRTNTEKPNGLGILLSVFGIFRYCKYRRRYRYFEIPTIDSVFWYTDPRLIETSKTRNKVYNCLVVL